MTMKVLIKGSIDTPPEPLPPQADQVQKQDYEKKMREYEAQKARFIATCKALGAAVARQGHTLMVGVPQWENLRNGRAVAEYIIEGASLEPPKKKDEEHQILFYGPRGQEPPDTTPQVNDTLQELENLSNVALNYRYLGKGIWSAAMIPDVEEADVVILIGGAEGTATIGYAAYSMKKPIVAITAFGGAAQNIFDDILFAEYERLIGQSDQITANDVRMLGAQWTDKEDSDDNRRNAQNVVTLAEKLVKAKSQSNKQAMSILWFTIGYLITFLLLWVLLFLQKINKLDTDVNFFLLLFVSSILGTGLRTLVSYQQNKIAKLSYTGLAIDMTIALVIAFGLALVYLIGGISFTGKVVVLDESKDTVFASIAVSMSLLGLAAGYVVPLNQLQERLEKVLAQEEKP